MDVLQHALSAGSSSSLTTWDYIRVENLIEYCFLPARGMPMRRWGGRVYRVMKTLCLSRCWKGRSRNTPSFRRLLYRIVTHEAGRYAASRETVGPGRNILPNILFRGQVFYANVPQL